MAAAHLRVPGVWGALAHLRPPWCGKNGLFRSRQRPREAVVDEEIDEEIIAPWDGHGGEDEEEPFEEGEHLIAASAKLVLLDRLLSRTRLAGARLSES